MLIDTEAKHKFADIPKRTKYQQSHYASHVSKVVLQETVLGLAEFFSKFSKIYFPVRLDQRGRLYCAPNYLDYKGNDLSKSLLLFAEPGVIKRSQTASIIYLKVYGANCYGVGGISRNSLNFKLKWIDENIDNILNYDNGILLEKAKDKLLFLSFCMEFKRFYDFYTDENSMEFYTYLPIQLDATCNGFQHMALLSNEETLFKELNITLYSDKPSNKTNDEQPNDFYNFLLHRLKALFEAKLDKGQVNDEKEKGGSYERLNCFLWDRQNLKKSIMTIPYNSSRNSMKKYIAESLSFVEYDGTYSWYTASNDTEADNKLTINNKDIFLLIRSLQNIITNDFEKIKKLGKYLKNIASLLNTLELPITWTLPTGLTIKQSYLKTTSTPITPFMYSKIKLNLKVTVRDKYDEDKQIISLMPNLIHSLDASSLTLLYNSFASCSASESKFTQFFSVHDCFATTCDKVSLLKTILASVYTDLYTDNPYLIKFDNSVLTNIEDNTDYPLDREKRLVYIDGNKPYKIHDIKWVINEKILSSKEIKKIDSQHIFI